MSGLTCFLFKGSMETRSDEATWSVSAEVSMRQITGEGKWGIKEHQILIPFPFSEPLSVFTSMTLI